MEELALILVLKNSKVYVGSSSQLITVYTDYNPLIFINEMHNSNQRLLRWALFNITVKHMAGKNIVMADTLSHAVSW